MRLGRANRASLFALRSTFAIFVVINKSKNKNMETLTANDLQQLQQKGITQEKLQQQLRDFKTGFPFARLVAPALKGHGVLSLSSQEQEHYRKLYREEAANNKILKFVPASGAATRMFKNLYACYESLKDYRNATRQDKAPENIELKPDVQEFFDRLPDFAFYEELENALNKIYGKSVASSLINKEYFCILDTLLENPQGLRYGKLPKALLLFHNYPDGPRMSLEEHLVEAALYASTQGVCHLHFTLSPEHREEFRNRLSQVLPKYESQYKVRYDISYSEQKPSTDTVAVTLQDEIFRDEDGRMVFRPGGHGALIENLNEIQADIVFIKNIDNVTYDALRQDTITYKELLAGILLQSREAVFQKLREIDSFLSGETSSSPSAGADQSRHAVGASCPDQAYLQELKDFATQQLCMALSEDLDSQSPEQQLEWFRQALNRPIRVCGVVKNTGEPGGGPFWVLAQGQKAPSLQIVESSQVDMGDARQKEIFNTSEFFNPVDLVCSLCDYKHEKFNLPDFVDPKTAFISQKSVKGTDIKAMELPGLWNGAMAHWITLFVEVPQTVFTPVKTVNDLLRPQHLAAPVSGFRN